MKRLSNALAMLTGFNLFPGMQHCPWGKIYPHFLSVNPDKNRAARRSFVKQRHGKGNTVGKKMQSIAAQARRAKASG